MGAHGRRFVAALLACTLLLGALAGGPAVGAAIGDHPASFDGTPPTTDGTGTTGNTSDSTTDTTENTTDSTTNTTEDTTDSTTDTIENTTDSTTDTTENTTDSTTDTTENTTDSTTDTIENTTDSTTNTTDSVTNTTDSAVENTTETVDNTTDSATDATDSTVENTTGTVDNATDSATDATDSTVDDTTDAVENTTDSVTDTTDSTVDDTTEGIEETTDPAVDDATDTVGNATDAVENTTDAAGNATGDAVDGVSNRTDDASAVENTTGDATNATDVLAGAIDRGTGSEVEAAPSTDEPGPGTGAESGDAGEGTARTPPEERAPASDGTDPDRAGGSVPVPGDPPSTAAGLLVLVALAGAAVEVTGRATGNGGLVQLAATARNVGSPRSWLRVAVDRVRRTLVVLRYSRYDDSDPLELDSRADVFDAVESEPGIQLTEIPDRADVPLSTVRYHARILEEEDLVESQEIRGRKRYFPAHEEDPELQSALTDESTAVLLKTMVRLDGGSVSELAEELGRDPSTITHHCKRLEADGLVERERDGRAVVNRAAPRVRRLLSEDAAVPTPAVADD